MQRYQACRKVVDLESDTSLVLVMHCGFDVFRCSNLFSSTASRPPSCPLPRSSLLTQDKTMQPRISFSRLARKNLIMGTVDVRFSTLLVSFPSVALSVVRVRRRVGGRLNLVLLHAGGGSDAHLHNLRSVFVICRIAVHATDGLIPSGRARR